MTTNLKTLLRDVYDELWRLADSQAEFSEEELTDIGRVDLNVLSAVQRAVKHLEQPTLPAMEHTRICMYIPLSDLVPEDFDDRVHEAFDNNTPIPLGASDLLMLSIDRFQAICATILDVPEALGIPEERARKWLHELAQIPRGLYVDVEH